MRLTLGGVLAGRVLDGAGGGVAKAWVYAGKWNPDEPRWTVQHTTTDDQGRYRITGIPAGSTVVRARCDGRRGVEAALDFVDAAVTEWHPVLRTTPGIRGRILDEHGDELEGYTVRAESADGHMPRKVKSSRDGSFVVRGCERNSYTLRVYHPKDWGGYTVAHRPSVVPDAGECVIRLSAESRALGGVKAVVLHADGRPVGRVQCTLWREPYSGGRNLHSEAGSGKIERQFLPPGRYRLDVRAPNYPLLQRHFTVRPGKTTDLSELRLSLPGTLLVKLRRLDGVPMRRGGLSIVDERNLHVGQIDVFDGVGKSELPGGRYTLISGPDWVPQLKHVIEITPGRETVAHLTARVCAPRTVRFVHPDVDKDLELDITLRARDGRVVFQREGSRWRKRSKFTPQITWRLGPGSYRLELKAGRGYRGAATIEVRKGSSAATIDVVLRRKRLPR